MSAKNKGLRASIHAVLGGLVAASLVAPLAARADTSTYEPVTSERLVNAQKDNGWLMYRRNYESTGYAPFDLINTANVAKLKVAFDMQSDLSQGHEAAPVVNGNYMFVTTPMDHLYALDATTGKQLWKYDYPIDPKALKTVCCDVVNRGEVAEADRQMLRGDDRRHRSCTVADIPDFTTPSAFSPRTFTPKTWCSRSSRVWTLRGRNSACEPISCTAPENLRPG